MENMTEQEYEATISLLPQTLPKEVVKDIMVLSHTLQNDGIRKMLDLGLIGSIKSKISYRVIKYVFDKCEFYNLTANREEIWETMEAYLHGTSLTPNQKDIFMDVILVGLRRYSNEFRDNFLDFYHKCKEARYI